MLENVVSWDRQVSKIDSLWLDGGSLSAYFLCSLPFLGLGTLIMSLKLEMKISPIQPNEVESRWPQEAACRMKIQLLRLCLIQSSWKLQCTVILLALPHPDLSSTSESTLKFPITAKSNGWEKTSFKEVTRKVKGLNGSEWWPVRKEDRQRHVLQLRAGEREGLQKLGVTPSS